MKEAGSAAQIKATLKTDDRANGIFAFLFIGKLGISDRYTRLRVPYAREYSIEAGRERAKEKETTIRRDFDTTRAERLTSFEENMK